MLVNHDEVYDINFAVYRRVKSQCAADRHGSKQLVMDEYMSLKIRQKNKPCKFVCNLETQLLVPLSQLWKQFADIPLSPNTHDLNHPREKLHPLYETLAFQWWAWHVFILFSFLFFATWPVYEKVTRRMHPVEEHQCETVLSYNHKGALISSLSQTLPSMPVCIAELLPTYLLLNSASVFMHWICGVNEGLFISVV